MGRFRSIKKVSLASVGTGWEDAYVEVSIPNFAEAKAVATVKQPETTEEQLAYAETVLTFLKDHFVGGKAPDESGLVELKADDLSELPVNAVSLVRESLLGEGAISPN